MENILNKLKNAVSNYKYKFVTAIVGLILTTVIYNYFIVPGLIYAIAFFGLFTIGYIFYGIYRGVINTWDEGSKGLAIFYGIMSVAFIALVAFLIIRAQIMPY